MAEGYYAAFLEFENGAPATMVHNGYGYFSTFELVPWAGDSPFRGSSAELRRAVRSGRASVPALAAASLPAAAKARDWSLPAPFLAAHRSDNSMLDTTAHRTCRTDRYRTADCNGTNRANGKPPPNRRSSTQPQPTSSSSWQTAFLNPPKTGKKDAARVV